MLPCIGVLKKLEDEYPFRGAGAGPRCAIANYDYPRLVRQTFETVRFQIDSMWRRGLDLFEAAKLHLEPQSWRFVPEPPPDDWATARNVPPGTMFLAALLSLAPAQPTYILSFRAAAVRQIHVVATLPLTSDTLRMSSGGASQLADGWATFVHDLKAFDGTTRLPLRQIPGGLWVISGVRPTSVNLTYDVGVAHDSVRWNVSGSFARGYSSAGTVFFAGRAVFIVSGGSDALPVRIHFQVPRGWSVATAYRAVPGSPATYEASSLSDLWGNGSLAGPLAEETIHVGDLEVLFAGGESMRKGIGLYARTVAPIVTTYAALMGGAPAGKLVVLANLGPRVVDNGGEAFRESISMLVAAVPDSSTRKMWGYTFAHELFHQWNPYSLPPADQTPFEWFVEGFTDYMTRQVMLRTGITTEDEFLEAMASSYRKYLATAGHQSLLAAGAAKGTNYDFLYSGGSSVAAALDADLRSRTHGARGVPQLLARMYDEYRRTRKPYDYVDLVRLVSDVAGADMTAFFSRYVNGIEVLPLASYLTPLGLTLRQDGLDVSIAVAPTATSMQLALLAALTAK